MIAATETPEARTVRAHPWELAGLGRAPFKFVGMVEEVFAMPDGTTKAGGSCAYCGIGIRYVFRCVSTDGKRFGVGCDCIARCHLPAEKIVGETKRALRTFKAAKVREKRTESRKVEAERRRAQYTAEREERIAGLADNPFYARLKANTTGNGFLAEMVASMEKWGALTPGQLTAAERVLEKIESAPARKAASHFLGAVGERVKLVGTVEFTKCIFRSVSYYDGPDRWLNKLRTDSGAVVVWFGAYALEEGKRVEGTATVKAVSEYQDEKQTTIKNPRWKDPA